MPGNQSAEPTLRFVSHFHSSNTVCFNSRFPIYTYHNDEYDFYGLPIHGNSGSKIGIDMVMSPVVTPETRTFDPDPIREKVCTEFLDGLIPKVQTKGTI